jgi:hypothetical protein
MPSMIKFRADVSHPDIQIRWLDGPHGEPIDFSSGWTATVQFVRAKRNTVYLTKADGFLLGDGSDGLANFVIGLTPNELLGLASVPDLVIECLAVNDATGERQEFTQDLARWKSVYRALPAM